MAAKKLVPFQPPGRKLVYDIDPDGITRPDTVPAALRFLVDEESTPGSGFGHRVQRELSAYPSVPEMTKPNDAPTIVDAPLQRATMPTPRENEPSYPAFPSQVPQSGPRHRMVSTVPPPRTRRSRESGSHVTTSQGAPNARVPRVTPHGVAAQAVASHVASQIAANDEQRRHPRVRSDAPVAARPQRLWPLLLATSVTTVLAVVIGTSLADGSLTRWSPRGFDAPVEALRGAIVPPMSVLPTAAAPAASPLPLLRVPVSDVPVVRVEDLPLAQQDEPEGEKTKPARRASRGRRKVAPPPVTE